jgi:hypothetical protein
MGAYIRKKAPNEGALFFAEKTNVYVASIEATDHHVIKKS